MNKPIRTTVFFGLLSGLLVLPVAYLMGDRLGWSLAFKLAVWADLAVYALLMARWSGTRAAAVLFPLAVLLGAALWPHSGAGFLLLALGVLSWVRSGLCFTGAPIRRGLAEAITIFGGSGLVVVWGSHTALAWALGIWLFFLVQALYFAIIPEKSYANAEKTRTDAFEKAIKEAERVLEGG